MLLTQRFPMYLVLLCFAVGLGAAVAGCGGKNKFSLAREKRQKDMAPCLALLKKKKYDKAIRCLESYKSVHFGQAGAAMADLAVADSYFLKKEYLAAAEAYQIFIQSNPTHPKIPYAYYKAGVSYLKESPKAIDRDQSYLDNAIEFLGTVLNYYSHTTYAKMARRYYDEARRKKAKKHFYVGRFYYKTREYLAAIPRFQTIVTEYPKLGLDEKSFYYLIRALVKTDQKDLAREYFAVFKDHYPDSSYVKKVASIF